MSYQDDLNALLSAGLVQIVTILDPQGNIYWTNQPEWQINGPALLQQWSQKPPSIEIGGIKFSVMRNRYPEYLVARNVQGGGLVIIAQAKNGYFFLTWTDSNVQADPISIQADVARMAAKFG